MFAHMIIFMMTAYGDSLWCCNVCIPDYIRFVFIIILDDSLVVCNNCIHLSKDIIDMVIKLVDVPLIIVVSRFESSGEIYTIF